MTMTTTAVAMGGVMSKEDETGTSSRTAAMASALSNVSSAPSLACRRPISFMGGTWLGSCRLAVMSTRTT
jgi:hypothetical protein